MARPIKNQDVRTENPTPQKRVYSKNQELDHDLFKLKVAAMIRNESWEEANPRYIDIEHCHIFHTIDSSGRKQETCSPVGGHFHKMRVQYNQDKVPEVECSPAMKYVRTKTGERIAVVIDHDDHVHEVEYIRSEKIKPRQVNPEWLKLQSEMSNKQDASVDGVVSV